MMVRNWGLGRLVGSWVLYWVVLLAVGLAPVARQYVELRRRGGQGTISVNWSGSTTQMILLIVGQPLAMTLLWLATRPRRP